MTYQGPQYPTAATSPTQDKPQSKLWFADGSWWALMRVSAGVTIHRLGSDHTGPTPAPSSTPASRAPRTLLWEGNTLFVVSRAGSGGLRVIELSYDGGTDRYTVVRSQQVANVAPSR